jgi:hypothetical protein
LNAQQRVQKWLVLPIASSAGGNLAWRLASTRPQPSQPDNQLIGNKYHMVYLDRGVIRQRVQIHICRQLMMLDYGGLVVCRAKKQKEAE